MKARTVYLVILSLSAFSAYANTLPINLGTAGEFAVLAGSTVTNTGPTIINGDVGVAPGTAITGFPPGGLATGTLEDDTALANQAEADLTTAFDFAGSEPCGTSLTGQDLGGLTLTSGVYCFASSAQLTGTLTLDAQGDPNAAFIFQIGSTLTTATAAVVDFVNGAAGENVFWQVGSSATLGTGTSFAGDILAAASITLTTDADINCGSALARAGAVTMDSNNITTDSAGCLAATAAPEPGTVTLIGAGFLLLGSVKYYRKSRRQTT